MLSFKPTFSLSTFIFIKRLFSSSSLSAIRVVSSAYERCGDSPKELAGVIGESKGIDPTISRDEPEDQPVARGNLLPCINPQRGILRGERLVDRKSTRL